MAGVGAADETPTGCFGELKRSRKGRGDHVHPWELDDDPRVRNCLRRCTSRTTFAGRFKDRSVDYSRRDVGPISASRGAIGIHESGLAPLMASSCVANSPSTKNLKNGRRPTRSLPRLR